MKRQIEGGQKVQTSGYELRKPWDILTASQHCCTVETTGRLDFQSSHHKEKACFGNYGRRGC